MLKNSPRLAYESIRTHYRLVVNNDLNVVLQASFLFFTTKKYYIF